MVCRRVREKGAVVFPLNSQHSSLNIVHQIGAKAAQHPAEFFGSGVEFLKIIRCEETLVAGDERLGDDLEDRTCRDFDEACVVRVRIARAALGDVRRDGDCGAAHLVGEAKAFVARKSARDAIHVIRERNRLLPSVELLEIEHGVGEKS